MMVRLMVEVMALLGRAHPFDRRQSDQHIARGAEVLHLHVRIAQRRNGRTSLGEVGRLAVGDFHQRAAGELHRQVQAAREQEKDSGQECDQRHLSLIHI